MNVNVPSLITKFISDPIKPIVATETFVIAGRTYEAYKRGGVTEARERAVEETSTTLVWLFGVKILSDIGDKILAKILGTKQTGFDVGEDIVRKPFENYLKKNPGATNPKKFGETSIAMMKGAKIGISIVLANLFIGMALPKINHFITNKAMAKKKSEAANKSAEAASKPVENNGDKFVSPSSEKFSAASRSDDKSADNPLKSSDMTSKNPLNVSSFKAAAQNGSKSVSFKANPVNVFTNAIESSEIGKLLSTDAGILAGRTYNARTNDERREILFRDVASIYFYMFSNAHIMGLLNKLESGHFDRLNPSSTAIITKELTELLKNGGKDVESFKKAVFGEGKVPDLSKLNFETEKVSKTAEFFSNLTGKKSVPTQVIKLEELLKTVTDDSMKKILESMAELQPERFDGKVITRNQIEDAFKGGLINSPEFLKKLFDNHTEGAYKDPLKYCSHKELYALKDEVASYVKRLCESLKPGEVVTEELLNKAKNSGIKMTGVNFLAAFTVSTAMLGIFIPKMQYYMTKMITGKNSFPGVNEDLSQTAQKASDVQASKTEKTSVKA